MNDRQTAWNRSLAAHPGELDLPELEVEGTIPAALVGGRYLLNGPGWVHIGGRLVHPFDGHGYLRAIDLRASGASLRARFVRTPAYEAEEAAGELVYRGLATNPSESWWRNLRASAPRNVANTTVVPWGGALLCGWEGGRPHALDPITLETRGEADFGGALPSGAFLAHMRVDGDRLIGLSIGMSRHTTLTFREFDRASKCVVTRVATLPAMVLAHDFVVTPRWYILAGNHLNVNMPRFLASLAGVGTLFEAVQAANPPHGTLYLIPRGRDGDVRAIQLDRPLFAVHFANAFDEGDDVVVDVCGFASFTFGAEFGYQGPRAPLDPGLPDQRKPQTLQRVRVAAGRSEATAVDVCPLGCDFPRVAATDEGRDAPAVVVATRAELGHSDPFDSVARIDLRTGVYDLWQAPANQFVGEPVFAPDPAGPGWVLAMVYDALGSRSTLAVFDASNVKAGPVAQVNMPLLPYGFHGEWVDGAAT